MVLYEEQEQVYRVYIDTNENGGWAFPMSLAWELRVADEFYSGLKRNIIFLCLELYAVFP